MAAIKFDEVVSLINESRTASIEDAVRDLADGRCRLYTGKYHFHVASYPFRVLYLLAGARKEDLAAAARAIPTEGDLHVVYPPSVLTKIR